MSSTWSYGFSCICFVFSFCSVRRDLHSFPTRRSSDLCVTIACGGEFARLLKTKRSTHARLHRSEEHTSELQSHSDLVCRLMLEKEQPRPLESQSARAGLRAARRRGGASRRARRRHPRQ